MSTSKTLPMPLPRPQHAIRSVRRAGGGATAPGDRATILSSRVVREGSGRQGGVCLLALLAMLPSEGTLVLSAMVSVVLYLRTYTTRRVYKIVVRFLTLEDKLSPLSQLDEGGVGADDVGLPAVRDVYRVLLGGGLAATIISGSGSVLLPLFTEAVASPN